MGQLSAYANEVDYRARIGAKATAIAPGELTEQLIGGSRLVELLLGLAPGYFNTHSATYTFDSRGGTVLRLRDRFDFAYCLTGVGDDGIGVDTERDGTFDGYAWDFADAWVRGLPENALLQGKPAEELELLGYITGAPVRSWPIGTGMVRVVSDAWGYTTVPKAIKDLTVHLTHDVRDGHRGGAGLTIPGPDGDIGVTAETWRIWMQVKAPYNRRIPVLL